MNEPGVRPKTMDEALDEVERALAELSWAIFEAVGEETEYKGNLQWADAAVDRAMRDMQRIRTLGERGMEI